MKIGKKIYTAKKPAHPDDAHTKAKRFFKRKGRKRARQLIKRIMEVQD